MPSAGQRRTAGRIVPPPHLGDPTPNNDDPFFVAIVDKMLGPVCRSSRAGPQRDHRRRRLAGHRTGHGEGRALAYGGEQAAAGDIMVCEMTVPTWVPLFATVAAIVADSGGILSHCAIVAREFHLPAVVGTRVGTEVIKDGWTITVDGTKGIVRIEERP